MIAQTLEENSSTKRRELKSLEVDIYSVFVPRQSPNGVGDHKGEQTVEIEEKEDSAR